MIPTCPPISSVTATIDMVAAVVNTFAICCSCRDISLGSPFSIFPRPLFRIRKTNSFAQNATQISVYQFFSKNVAHYKKKAKNGRKCQQKKGLH
ncbi:hypothetical protein POVWA2_020430 [Plasmodium ovale wallikeri]|uniref:Uncharacterized protein n=1 Tax=Plasmodium ovale wallikeri TaxID=864142 RepID=A0A1A8YSS0_PLAOA|nr:hypothetical protein POVWA1_020250 [Plasmodium ovale wallikeri]SBT34554.1 hypothetical protein POVWA2_020430 [Plasmodium ovale wallikeri]